MKKSNILFRGSLAAGAVLALGSCSQEAIFEPSANGLPQASDYQIGISVDDLNNVELNILDAAGATAKGVYPIWYVNGSTRPSTSLTYRDLITIAGDYPVEMKVGNANGVSDGTVTGTIHITKTIFDFTPYMRALTNDSSKEWAVDGTKDGNMACGPDGSNPAGWWNGGPGCKEEEGVYENTLTFAYKDSDTEGAYTFNPGAAGTFYVNKGVHTLPGYEVNNPDNDADFRVAAKEVESSFILVAEGPNLYLKLPAHTPFPYIASEAGFDNPKYRVVSCTKGELTLVEDLEGISWQYILAPKAEGDVTTTGFKYDYEHNLWKSADISVASTWFAAEGWSELPTQPDVTLTANNGISFHAPEDMGNDQWMGQVHLKTNIELKAGVTYDFSCNVNVPKDGAVTVKLQKEGDDNVFFAGTGDRVDVTSGGSIVWFSDLEGFDGTLAVAFDFGGFGGSDITVSNIVIKEHQYDDGTKIPAASSAPSISEGDNMFKDIEIVKTSTWFADGSWSLLPDQPEVSFTTDGYSFTAPAGVGPDQWQGQIHMWTNVETSAENQYDFLMTIESDKDLTGVTVKIQKGDALGEEPGKDDDDKSAIVEGRIDVEAGEPTLYFFKGKKGIDTKNLQVCMDFGGIPEGTKVTVSDIRMAVSK